VKIDARTPECVLVSVKLKAGVFRCWPDDNARVDYCNTVGCASVKFGERIVVCVGQDECRQGVEYVIHNHSALASL